MDVIEDALLERIRGVLRRRVMGGRGGGTETGSKARSRTKTRSKSRPKSGLLRRLGTENGTKTGVLRRRGTKTGTKSGLLRLSTKAKTKAEIMVVVASGKGVLSSVLRTRSKRVLSEGVVVLATTSVGEMVVGSSGR